MRRWDKAFAKIGCKSFTVVDPGQFSRAALRVVK